MSPRFTSIEICAGAGGQAIGLELAGFAHAACVELDPAAVATLRLNRGEEWQIIEADVREWSFDGDTTIDLLAGGVPCPPYSIAGRQLGADDERDLFAEVLRLAAELEPRALMIENVRGLLASKFDGYRASILSALSDMGYVGEWRLLQASDFGVPQLRPRSILVALRAGEAHHFEWPTPSSGAAPTVGEVLLPLMSKNGWRGAKAWAKNANSIAPTLVGGSKKHGGADLGPTRAKRQWADLGVNGLSLADDAPDRGFVGTPRLTVEMAAALQGFPSDWQFAGRKTARYRQVGNAFPPPVAAAVARQIVTAFMAADAQPDADAVAAVA